MAGRHQCANQRCVGRDVDRIVRVVALFLHLWDQYRPHGRNVGHGRSRYSPEQGASKYVAHTQAAPHMPRDGLGEGHDLVGDTAVHHDLAGEDEKRDGKKRKWIHARDHLLETNRQWQAFEQQTS